MEERHKFLTEQLEDLKRTRKDLLDIVREVDARVEQVFTEAYADVEKAFDQTFSRLFPGGEGRLVLTDPGDMLTTGVEVEAGRRARRSSGSRCSPAASGPWSRWRSSSRSSRPVPRRSTSSTRSRRRSTTRTSGGCLQIYEELRENSQLLVITHQKRTMEVGDALYGVTMRGDGVSAVISQRLRDAEPA